MDCSLLGSSVHRILQARILEWVVMASSRGSSWPRDGTHTCFVSCIGRRVFATEPPEKPYKELPTMKCLWPLPCQKIKTKFLKLVLRMTRIYLVESAIMLPPYPLGHILWSQFDSSLQIICGLSANSFPLQVFLLVFCLRFNCFCESNSPRSGWFILHGPHLWDACYQDDNNHSLL